MWTSYDLDGRLTARYVRISEDATREAKGIGRQEQDETAYILAANGVPGPVYPENDTSAYKKRRVVLDDGTVVWRVIRPQWQQMLADLRAGKVEAMCVDDLDRLARDPRDLEDAIELVEHYHRPIVGVTGGFDLMTDNGRFAARILVAQANKASADTGRRVRRKHLQLQQEGVLLRGSRAFGWQADQHTKHPGEAAEITQAAERIVAGWPTAAVVVDLNERGVRTSTGKRWLYSTLVQMLRNPRLAGYRARTVAEFDEETGSRHTHKEIVRRADGSPVMGTWDRILTVAEWEAVVAVIGARSAAKPGNNTRHYLLTGTARCGNCGHRMRGHSNASRPHQDTRTIATFVYACPSRAAGGCGGVTRNGPLVDRYVTEAVLARVEAETTDAVAQIAPWSGQAEYDQVTTDIADLTAAWKARPRQISSTRYFALLPDLEAREKQLATDRGRYTAAVRAAQDAPADLRAEWDGYPLAQRRAIIAKNLSALVIHKATRRGAGFNPDLLEPVWHD